MILTSIVSGLAKHPDFQEYTVLSEASRQRLSTIDASIASAGKVIGGLAKSVHLGAAKVLTSVTAVMMPSDCLANAGDMSRRDFCQLLGMNRKSKYFDIAIENRKQYESFLKLEGDIKVGEKVSCRASPEAIITSIEKDGPVVVTLLPFGTEKKFKSLSSG